MPPHGVVHRHFAGSGAAEGDRQRDRVLALVGAGVRDRERHRTPHRRRERGRELAPVGRADRRRRRTVRCRRQADRHVVHPVPAHQYRDAPVLPGHRAFHGHCPRHSFTPPRGGTRQGPTDDWKAAGPHSGPDDRSPPPTLKSIVAQRPFERTTRTTKLTEAASRRTFRYATPPPPGLPDHRPHQPVQPVVFEQAQRPARTTPGASGERSRTGTDEAAFGAYRGASPGPSLPVMARLPALRPRKTFTLSGTDGRRGARSEFPS